MSRWMATILWFCVLFLGLWTVESATIEKLPTAKNEWELHKQRYGLDLTGEEETMRKTIFNRNMRRIAEHNAEDSLFKLGMNSLGHLEDHEVAAMLLHRGLLSRSISATSEPAAPEETNGPAVALPKHVDWRTSGVVSHMKDQGYCGSCYAFSAVSALESAYAIDTGVLINLSEQDALDCTLDTNLGCDGGTIDSIFEFAAKRGIATQDSYPYHAKTTACRHNTTRRVFAFRGYKMVAAGSEGALKLAVAFKGPVSVAIDASSPDFRFYKHGIYSSRICGNNPGNANHAVVVVGYGSENGHDYYLVRNSWGTSWGMDGYVKFARNDNNMCGIANMAVYPVV